MRRLADIAAAGLTLWLVWKVTSTPSRSAETINWLAQMKAREIKTTVLDHQFRRGTIGLVEYERSLSEIWGLESK